MSGRDVVIGFQDESSPQTTANTVRVWSDGRPIAVKNAERMRSNVLGLYAMNGRSVSSFPDGSKAEDMCAFLDEVRAANGDRHVLMALDNAPTHRSAMVAGHAASLGISLLFLPPYSPQLNPIEQVWRAAKRAVSTRLVLHRDHLVGIIRESFEAEVAKDTYFGAWKAKFLP